MRLVQHAPLPSQSHFSLIKTPLVWSQFTLFSSLPPFFLSLASAVFCPFRSLANENRGVSRDSRHQQGQYKVHSDPSIRGASLFYNTDVHILYFFIVAYILYCSLWYSILFDTICFIFAALSFVLSTFRHDKTNFPLVGLLKVYWFRHVFEKRLVIGISKSKQEVHLRDRMCGGLVRTKPGYFFHPLWVTKGTSTSLYS